MGTEEGKEVQANKISNIFNKIITENFPNLEKVLPNRLDQNRTSQQHNIIKTTSIENRERILNTVREYTK
jgi:hypothetical protein